MAQLKQDDPATVAGRIIIFARVRAFENGTAHIFLQDVSQADVPCRQTGARVSISGVKHAPVGAQQMTIIPFRMNPSRRDLNPKNFYSLRVWVDVNSDGQQSKDDLYSDRIYPVLTRGAGNYAEILLDRQD